MHQDSRGTCARGRALTCAACCCNQAPTAGACLQKRLPPGFGMGSVARSGSSSPSAGGGVGGAPTPLPILRPLSGVALAMLAMDIAGLEDELPGVLICICIWEGCSDPVAPSTAARRGLAESAGCGSQYASISEKSLQVPSKGKPSNATRHRRKKSPSGDDGSSVSASHCGCVPVCNPTSVGGMPSPPTMARSSLKKMCRPSGL